MSSPSARTRILLCATAGAGVFLAKDLFSGHGAFGPADATASLLPEGLPETSALPDIGDLRPHQSSLSIVADRLEQWSAEVQAPSVIDHDIFDAALVFVPPEPKPEAAEALKAKTVVDPTLEFLATTELKAIITGSGGSGGAVRVNDQVVRQGQTYKGFRLTEVRNRSATFESDGHSVSLTLPTGLASAFGDATGGRPKL